ncbi:FkbM family methyltransferase [Agaribacter marinus]|uniref:Methyltransferase FkbM domain-containing protein n=1 Tax=Agaribacter marinus TaxID=1431249 RepID=A0AA37SWX8_9ALTE|nr:FkbM family methyltransferase [Agaribacter marinus]GLR71308.1 hypothetical protein GCM10007852_22160 [Agaribacter marinus]
MSVKSKLGWLLSKLLYEWNPIKHRRKQKFYANFIGNGDLCFDVGSHLGDRADTWLRLNARVVAFEPQPNFADYLSQKFAANTQFNLERVGLGEAPGNATLAISTLFPTLSTLAGNDWEKELTAASNLRIEFDKKITIETSTLDAMIQKYGTPHFCKIDVEGFELQVLKGLSVALPYISFEFLSFSETRMQECLDVLKSLGYKHFNWSYKETFQMRFDHWVDDHQVVNDIKQFKKGIFSGDIYCRFDSCK